MPMMEMFDRGIQLRMGQAHVKRWIPDLMPMVADSGDSLGVRTFVPHHLPLDQARHGCEMFRDKADGCIKVVLQSCPAPLLTRHEAPGGSGHGVPSRRERPLSSASVSCGTQGSPVGGLQAVGRVCVVADRGFISKQTLGQLENKDRGWDFILGVRMRASKEARQEVVGKLGSLAEAEPRKGFTVVHGERKNSKDPSPLEVKEVQVGERRYVVCYNPEQARKDAADRSRIVEALRATLKQGDKALVGNKGFRKYLRVEGKHFEVNEAKLKAEARYDGLWVLRTNTALPVAQVALRYKELWMVERLFRNTKTLLKTRPIFHKLDETIRGHGFCTFLGLVLLKELDRCLRAAGLDLEHNEVMRDLKALQRMRIDNGGKVFWLRSQVQGCCAKVFGAVGVALPPLLTLEPEDKRLEKKATGEAG